MPIEHIATPALRQILARTQNPPADIATMSRGDLVAAVRRALRDSVLDRSTPASEVRP